MIPHDGVVAGRVDAGQAIGADGLKPSAVDVRVHGSCFEDSFEHHGN